MKLIKTTGLAAVVLSMLALGAAPAAAQAAYTPSLSVTVNGSTVTIEWSAINEAQGYRLEAGTAPGASNIVSGITVPASIRRIVVDAPPGLYYMRVRAVAGPFVGPPSNEGVANVGGGGCSAPGAPAVSFAVSGPVVSINWGLVPGASSYRVQYSRFSGGTELAYDVSGVTASHQQYVPILGTFFARVVAFNACGNATGNEVAFTIDNLSGSGPRTPDPAPGQLLPKPSYGQTVVQQMAAAYPADLYNSCREHGGNNHFMFKVLRELRKYDSRWGLNWKRGWPGDLSQDIITYNPTALPDAQASQIYLWDMIGGHCGSSPSWNWADVTSVTWAGQSSGICNPNVTHCAMWTIQPFLAAGYIP